jgi:uncharacterized membrane protein (UPF0127 family)
MIINKTKDEVLAREVEIADSTRKKAKGLMFRDSLPEDHALLMTFSSEGNHKIWMFGMRFPIDIVFLDSEKRVIGIHENAKPLSINPKTWKTYCSTNPDGCIRYVIESNPGTIKKTKTEPGDVLEF